MFKPASKGRAILWSVGLLSALAATGGFFLNSHTSRRIQVTTSRQSKRNSSERLALPESERKYIWEIEHRVTLLDFRFWPRLSEAIRKQNRDEIRDLFSSNASSELLHDSSLKMDSLPLGRIETSAASISGNRPASIVQLIESLLALRGKFDGGSKVSIKTVFLSPDERSQLHGPWHGRLLLRVWGRSNRGNPAEAVVEADFRLKELQESVANRSPWLTSIRIDKTSFRQSDRFLFLEVAKSWGIDVELFRDNWLQRDSPPEMVTGGVYLSDYDVDGKIDVLIVDSQTIVLCRQVSPSKFEDATVSAGLASFPPGAVSAFGDFDSDGYPDLIANNRVYRNTRNASFQLTGNLRFTDPDKVRGFAVADYDRDGKLDIYVARTAPPPRIAKAKTSWLHDLSGPGNSLLRNRGGFRFEDVTEKSHAGAGKVSCFTAAWFDANGDMWPDLFAGDEFGSPVLLVNKGDGTFDSRTITGDFGGFCMGVAAGDLDDDGRIDLSLANMYSKAGERVLSNLNLKLYPQQIARKIRHIVDGSELWHNRGNLKFESKGRASGIARVGWAYGPCLADLDNDGRLDMYAPAGFYSVSRKEPDG